jgi:hypothetical protein
MTKTYVVFGVIIVCVLLLYGTAIAQNLPEE